MVKAFGINAVCVGEITLTMTGPSGALGATDTVAIRLVGDSTVVECTVMPAPNPARLVPTTNCEFGDPVIRIAAFVVPRAADDTVDSDSMTISRFWPTLISPVARLRTEARRCRWADLRDRDAEAPQLRARR